MVHEDALGACSSLVVPSCRAAFDAVTDVVRFIPGYEESNDRISDYS